MGPAFSYFYEMKSGVRQGGVLSPFLFAIFIDDFVKLIDMEILAVKLVVAVLVYFYMQMILSCWHHQLRLYSL